MTDMMLVMTNTNTCSGPECGRPVYAKGLCAGHRSQVTKYHLSELRPIRERRSSLEHHLCTYDGCTRRRSAHGLCDGHYAMQRRTGFLGPLRTYTRPWPTCTFEGCDLPHKSKGFCDTHYEQQRRGAAMTPLGAKEPTWTPNPDGYLLARIGGRVVLQHRWVMEQAIGRELLPEETVHHKNLVKNDNRIENLELWSGVHPRGARTEDLVSYALEILALYAPDQLKGGG